MSRDLDVGIPADPCVKRDQADAVVSGRRDNDLIGRIGVKVSGKTARLHGNVRSQVEQADAGIGQGRMKPIAGRHRETEATSFYEFRDLPTGDRAHAERC